MRNSLSNLKLEIGNSYCREECLFFFFFLTWINHLYKSQGYSCLIVHSWSLSKSVKLLAFCGKGPSGSNVSLYIACRTCASTQAQEGRNGWCNQVPTLVYLFLTPNAPNTKLYYNFLLLCIHCISVLDTGLKSRKEIQICFPKTYHFSGQKMHRA